MSNETVLLMSSYSYLTDMKKLLSSKKSYADDECSISVKADLPKRTLTSAWTIRNDSSNVSSILQPENHVQFLKQYDGTGSYKKCPLGDNSCYCREKKIKPKLMSRPRTCLSLDNFKDQVSNTDLLRRPLKQRYMLQECQCKANTTKHINSTNSQLLKRYYDDLENKCSCLKYTRAREDYQLFREEQKEEELKEFEDYNEPIEATKEDQEEKRDEEENYSISTIMGTKIGTTKTTLSYDLEDQEQAIEHLNAFRNDHYFETHSVEDLAKDVPNHTCIHQFRLDDRLLPEPLKVDPYGRSRCSICSKPMEGDTMQLSKSYFSDKPSSVTLRNLAKCSELGLVPRSISLGGEKSKIELRVDPNEKRKFGMLVGKIRKPQYFNTFALRQQKMSC